MRRIITELWYGNLDPIKQFAKNNSEIKQLESLMESNLEKLEVNCNLEVTKSLEKYNELVKEYMLLNVEQAYCDGFCLGTKIVVEALMGAEQIFNT